MRTWIERLPQQKTYNTKRTQIMKTTIKSKKTQQKRSASQQPHAKAKKPSKPVALDVKIAVTKANTTAPAVDHGQLALFTPSAPITWDSVSGFDPVRVNGMKLEDLLVEIKGRLPLIDEAIVSIGGWMPFYVKAAIQIGLLLIAIKDQVGHGKFGECLKTHFSGLKERTAQRYMKAAKTTALSEIKPGQKLQDLYSSLVKLEDSGTANANTSAGHTNTVPALTPARVVSRLTSLREFIENAVDALPVEKFDSSTRDHLLKEFSALSALLQKVSTKLTKLSQPKLVKGVEIPVCSNGPALRAI